MRSGGTDFRHLSRVSATIASRAGPLSSVDLWRFISNGANTVRGPRRGPVHGARWWEVFSPCAPSSAGEWTEPDIWRAQGPHISCSGVGRKFCATIAAHSRIAADGTVVQAAAARIIRFTAGFRSGPGVGRDAGVAPAPSGSADFAVGGGVGRGRWALCPAGPTRRGRWFLRRRPD